MKSQIAFACFAVFFAQSVVSGFLAQAADKKEKVAAFSLADVKYFHRFTKDDQHEYTPEGQEDLKTWTDMTTIHYYRKAKDGEALAAIANAVLENYKANRAKVVRTDSVPKTKDKPAEHLIVVIFGRPEFLEVVFARFRMHDGVGTAVIYSHRVYGNKVGNEMSAWLEKNGPDTEKNLLKWDAMPKLPQEILREMYNTSETSILANHPNLPEDLMRAIDKRANDKITGWFDLSSLARNRKLPRDLLDKYLVDHREAVRNAAQENPQLNPAYKGPGYERLGGP